MPAPTDRCPAAQSVRGSFSQRLGARLVEGVGVVVTGVMFVTTLEQARDAANDAHRDGKDIVVGGWRERMKRDRAVGAFLPRPPQ